MRALPLHLLQRGQLEGSAVNLRLIDFVYYSTLGLRVTKQKKKGTEFGRQGPWSDGEGAVNSDRFVQVVAKCSRHEQVINRTGYGHRSTKGWFE